MLIRSLPVICAACLLLAAGCSSVGPAADPSTLASTAPSTQPGSAAWWADMTAPLHGQGHMDGPVYVVNIPRTDLWLQSEMGDVPVEAGICSTFYFYRCECGLMKLVGQFALPDYEVNDVIDSLRNGAFTIVSLSPILFYAKPQMMSLRFQAEGHTDELVVVLRGALERTGPAREATRPSKF